MGGTTPPNIPQQIDWSHFRLWQIWDPIPWLNILDKERLEKILDVQIKYRIQEMKTQIAHLEEIQKIVTRR